MLFERTTVFASLCLLTSCGGLSAPKAGGAGSGGAGTAGATSGGAAGSSATQGGAAGQSGGAAGSTAGSGGASDSDAGQDVFPQRDAASIDADAAPTSCRYDDPNRVYQHRGADMCAAIDFTCPKPKYVFVDACGCGCEVRPWCVARCQPPAGSACCNGNEMAAPTCDSNGAYVCPPGMMMRSFDQCLSAWRPKDAGPCDVPPATICCSANSDIASVPRCTDAGVNCQGLMLMFTNQCGTGAHPPPSLDGGC